MIEFTSFEEVFLSVKAYRLALDPSIFKEEESSVIDLSTIVLPSFYKDNRAISWVNEAYLGLPERTGRGASSSYFISKVAVFKPRDEVIGGKNALDRVGYSRRRVRSAMGIVPGQETGFEVAASRIFSTFFMTDQTHSMVPETVMATLASLNFSTTGIEGKLTSSDLVKSGSLQRYVEAEIIHVISLDSVIQDHEIELMMAFDLALYNVDRNQNNIIVSKSEDGSFHLNLIDNSLLCSESFKTKMDVFWIEMVRSKRVFSEKLKSIILSWDPKSLIAVMQETFRKSMLDLDIEEKTSLSLTDRQIRTLEFAIVALQEGVKIELTAADLYHIYDKESFDLSAAEKKISECEGKDIRAVLSEIFSKIFEKKQKLEDLVDHDRKFFAYLLGSDKDIDLAIADWLELHPPVREKRLKSTHLDH